MKKYKFRLEALLKVRKLKEQQCKMQIGKLQVEVRELHNKIIDHKNSISIAYESQEEVLKQGATGQEIGFYPYMFDGNLASIKKINKQIKNVEEQISELHKDLSQYRADVKVIEKMKEKDKHKYKKMLEKKELEIIEEQTQNWKQVIG